MLNYNDNTRPKRCTKCNIKKSISEFSKDKSKPDGLYSSCKLCVSIRQKKDRTERKEIYKVRDRQRWIDRADKRNAERRREYALNPELIRERNRLSRNKNIEKARQRDRKRYPKEKEIRHKTAKRYYLNNKHIYQAATSRRLARERGLPDTFTKDDWSRALAYFDNRCAVCGRRSGLWHKLAADHWIPINNPHCPGTVSNNIVPLCHGDSGCNCSKKDSEPNYWLSWKFGARKAKRILKRIEGYFLWTQSLQL